MSWLIYSRGGVTHWRAFSDNSKKERKGTAGTYDQAENNAKAADKELNS